MIDAGSTFAQGPGGLNPLQVSPNDVPQEFSQYVTLVLWKQGVDVSQIDPGQFQQLMNGLWQDPFLQHLYQSAYVGSYTTDPSTGIPLSDSNFETAIQRELFDPTQSHSQYLVSTGVNLLLRSGKQLSSAQSQYGANLGGGNPAIMQALARAAQETGVPYNVALAVAVAESGLDPNAIGDQGCSHGLFQLNTCGGEGVGMSPESLKDPYQNALRALQQFAAVAAQDPSIMSDPGRWAAAAQRPADPSGYAVRVNNLIQSGFGGSPSSLVPKPFDGNYPITKDFGEPGEVGSDYAMPQGTMVYAPFAGTIQVEDSGKSNWGKRVFVRLDNGYTFAVGHMHGFSVSNGQRVNPGDPLGESGGDVSDPSSGESTGAHIEIQWISPGGNYLNPHTILDPILSGQASFRSLNLTGAEGSGVSATSARDRTLGIDPILEAKYPTALSEFQRFFGRHPTANELNALIAHGTTQTELDNYLRLQPSHIAGISMGMYQDVKGNLDSITNSIFGHSGTDGMVKDLVDQGKTSPTAVKFWLEQMDIAGKMDPKMYNQIYQLNVPHMAAIYNEKGFDPRIAAAQHQQGLEQGLVPQPTGAQGSTSEFQP